MTLDRFFFPALPPAAPTASLLGSVSSVPWLSLVDSTTRVHSCEESFGPVPGSVEDGGVTEVQSLPSKWLQLVEEAS